MNKSLALPHKIDGDLLEILKKHLSGKKDKEEQEHTELSCFKSTKDGGAELIPAVVSAHGVGGA